MLFGRAGRFAARGFVCHERGGGIQRVFGQADVLQIQLVLENIPLQAHRGALYRCVDRRLDPGAPTSRPGGVGLDGLRARQHQGGLLQPEP